MTDMEVDDLQTTGAKDKDKGKKEGKKRFEVKKVLTFNLPLTNTLTSDCFVLQWNAVSLWAWGMRAPTHAHP
jgi:hypothetical protein